MKNLFVILLFSMLSFAVSGQILDKAFNGILSPIVQTGGTAPDFNFQGLFQNSQGQFAGADAPSDDMVVVMVNDGECFALPVTSINAGSVITGTVTDPSGSLASLPSGMAFIGQMKGDIVLQADQITAELHNCIENHFRLNVRDGNFIYGVYKGHKEAGDDNVPMDGIFEFDGGSIEGAKGSLTRRKF